jgi:hypothetical protein
MKNDPGNNIAYSLTLEGVSFNDFEVTFSGYARWNIIAFAYKKNKQFWNKLYISFNPHKTRRIRSTLAPHAIDLSTFSLAPL